MECHTVNVPAAFYHGFSQHQRCGHTYISPVDKDKDKDKCKDKYKHNTWAMECYTVNVPAAFYQGFSQHQRCGHTYISPVNFPDQYFFPF